MNPLRRRVLLSLLKSADVTVAGTCFAGAAVITHPAIGSLRLAELPATRIAIRDLVACLLMALSCHAIFSAFRLYDSRRLSSLTADILDLLGASTTITAVIGAIAFVAPLRVVSLEFLLIFWTALVATMIIHRLIQRSLLRLVRRRGRNLRNVLVVGANARGIDFADRIKSRSELGYRVIGFADEDSNDAQLSGSAYSRVADLDGLGRFLRCSVVDEVVIALPASSFHTHGSAIAVLCEQQGITTRVLSNIFDLRLAQVRAEEFHGASVITNYTGLAYGWPVFVKRGTDIVISAALLVLLMPLMVLIAMAVKLTSSGPALFSQSRLGYNKRRFNIYKFRSMVSDAEQRLEDVQHLNEMTGPVFKIANDPRVTPLGRFLRKTSLDELPQLLNVLKGDMSLVGPRPLPDRDYEGFQNDWQRRRFSVRPGITCLWQINGRNSIPFEKWMQMDLQYIDKWSLSLDFRILLRTIPAVLKGAGAT